MTDSTPLTRKDRRAAERVIRPLFTAAFWQDLIERVVSSAAGGALAVVTASTFILNDPVQWTAVALGAGTAALVSILKGLIAASAGTGSASLDPRV